MTAKTAKAKAKARTQRAAGVFERIPEEAVHVAAGKKGFGVRWGWKEWRALAPALTRHIHKHGRVGLTAAMVQAQEKHLPPELHRPPTALSVAASPSSVPDVLALMQYVQDHPEDQGTREQRNAAVHALHPAAVRAPKAKPAPKQRATAPAAAPLAPPTPSPLPYPSTDTTAPRIEQVLALPLSAFLPSLRTWVEQNLHATIERLWITHEGRMEERMVARMEESMRRTLTEVVGGPASPKEASTPAAEPDPAPEACSEPTAPAAAPAEASTPESSTPAAVPDLHALPHDLETQLSAAAKALGLEVPPPKRSTVVAVGLHPKTQQECERFYGKALRFIFLRPDEFNAAKDLPASTECLLLCRKTLSKELQQLVHRYALPCVHVANEARAVFEAVRNVLDDVQPPNVNHLPPVLQNAQHEDRAHRERLHRMQ